LGAQIPIWYVITLGASQAEKGYQSNNNLKPIKQPFWYVIIPNFHLPLFPQFLSIIIISKFINHKMHFERKGFTLKQIQTI